MSVKKGLIGFGLSASIIAGGAFSITEWHHERIEVATELACRTAGNVGGIACKDVITTNGAVADTADFADVLGVVGILGLVAGGIGVMSSLEEVMKDEKREEGALADAKPLSVQA